MRRNFGFWMQTRQVRPIDWSAIELADYPPVTDRRKRRLAKRATLAQQALI